MDMLKPLRVVALGAALAGIGLSALAQTTKRIEYRETVTVNVGQSVVVHGYRGECGKLPAKGDISFPALKTGKLSIGAAGIRLSNRCGGDTPALQVIFTATTAGREKFEVQGDPISVRVRK